MRESSVIRSLLLAATAALARTSQATPEADLPPIKVHIIPHSHMDAGWKITVDQDYHWNIAVILGNVFEQLE